MPKLTETQSLILTAGSRRPGNLALPLPGGLAGAAAKMAVGRMIERGWLQEVDADRYRCAPLWRETGDGRGTTLVVTEAGLLAIGIDPVVAQTMGIARKHVTREPETKPPAPRAGTKQALLISLLQAPEGATMEEITASTGWLAHTARGVMSGALGKKLGLTVTSTKQDGRGRVYGISRPGEFSHFRL